MCTYQTEQITLRGSGKGPGGWFEVTSASVYLDHPVHASESHTVNIDLRNADLGPSARVAVELNAGSARSLAAAILATLDRAPAGLVEKSSA